MSEIHTDLAAKNICLKSHSKESVLKIGHHDLLIWDQTSGWQINPAFLLHAASKITWNDPNNNEVIDFGELGFDDKVNQNPTSKIHYNIPKEYIVTDEESTGIVICIVSEPKKIKGKSGTIYYLTKSIYENSKGILNIDEIDYCVIGSSDSNNSYLDLYGNLTKTEYGHFFNTVINLEHTVNIDKILFEPMNDKGSFYELDVHKSMTNININGHIVKIPNKGLNFKFIDKNWIVLQFDHTRKIEFTLKENYTYQMKTNSHFNSTNYVDVNTYSISVQMYVDIHGINQEGDMLFVQDENGNIAGESYDVINTSTGSRLFIILLYGDNVERNYSFYYYNGNLGKIYLYGKMSLNIQILETYNIFATVDDPLKFNNFDTINKTVKSKYDWVSINVKPKINTMHSITDVFASMLIQDQGKVLDGIRTKNNIWTISNDGIVGIYFDGISWKTNTSTILPNNSLFILETNVSKNTYNWMYKGIPYINNEEIVIELNSGYNWIGYPLQETTNIANYVDMLNNMKSIRSQSEISVKNLSELIGSLDRFIPNEGYIIEMENPTTLTFKNTLEFMVIQNLASVNYNKANEWILDVSGFTDKFTLNTISSNNLELSYMNDTLNINLVYGDLFKLNKSIFKYERTGSTPLITFGNIVNIHSIEIEVKYGFTKIENTYYNNIFGVITIETKDHIYAQSVINEYNYSGLTDGTSTPIPTTTPTTTPETTNPNNSVINNMNITFNAHVGFSSVVFTVVGTNNWMLIVSDASNNNIINKEITQSDNTIENLTYHGTINVETYALINGIKYGDSYTTTYYIPLQITDLIITQTSLNYDVNVSAKTNTNVPISYWSIKTNDNYIPLTNVSGESIVLTFDQSKEGTTTFTTYAILNNQKSGNDYSEVFNISRPLMSFISNVDVVSSPMDNKTKLTFTATGYNISHWYLKVTQNSTLYTFENNNISSNIFEYNITLTGDFNFEAYALHNGVKSGDSFYGIFNVTLQITDLLISQENNTLNVNIDPVANGVLNTWTLRTTDDVLPLTTTTDTIFTFTFPESGDKTFEAYANIDNIQSGSLFSKSFNIADLNSMEPNVTFYVKYVGHDGTYNMSDVYINMNNLYSINGIISDTFNITTVSVEFSSNEAINIIESGENTSEYTSFSYIANGKMFTYYSTLSSGVPLYKSKQFVTRIKHSGSFSGEIPMFSQDNTLITGQNFMEANVQLIPTGLIKKKNLNFSTISFNNVKQTPSYYGDISAPYGVVTILDFINFLKMVINIPGYGYDEIGNSTSIFFNVFDDHILKQTIQIYNTSLDYQSMLSRKPTILDAISLIKMVVGVESKIPFVDKKPPDNTPSQIFDGNVDLGRGFSMVSNDDINDPILQFTYEMDSINTPLITLKAQDGDVLIIDPVKQGSTKISDKWVMYWPRDESSINRDFYITYDFGYGPVPQTLVIPDTNPLGLDSIYNVVSSIELGKLWAMDTTRGVVDIYYRETQISQYYQQVIVGKNIFSEASYMINDDDYYYSDYTTDED